MSDSLHMMKAHGLQMLPLRLVPGSDLKRGLDKVTGLEGFEGGFVLAGIGSLETAAVRFAGQEASTFLQGPLEILTLQGSLSRDGCHLHIALSDANGTTRGGHVAPGCVVCTTAEILIARVPGFHLGREYDAATGYRELSVRPSPSE